MTNPLKALRELTAGPPLLTGTVTWTDGTSSQLTLPGGGVITVRGTATIGATVYHRGGAIEGDAPDLPGVDIEV